LHPRREFLRLLALSAAALGIAPQRLPAAALPAEAKNAGAAGTGTPLVLSTWDFGEAANAAAWQILERRGNALDAVEAGARVPEADPENHSVGLGGYPDRDGHVTWTLASWTTWATWDRSPAWRTSCMRCRWRGG
jgi:N4-(beta-N-acetylglucosaminyl)-L-asparaginase